MILIQRNESRFGSIHTETRNADRASLSRVDCWWLPPLVRWRDRAFTDIGLPIMQSQYISPRNRYETELDCGSLNQSPQPDRAVLHFCPRIHSIRRIKVNISLFLRFPVFCVGPRSRRRPPSIWSRHHSQARPFCPNFPIFVKSLPFSADACSPLHS